MSYFQKHLKTISSENQDPFARSSISNSQIANKFKKQLQNKSKVSQANTIDETIRANRRQQHEEQPLAEYIPRQSKPSRRQQPKPIPAGKGKEKSHPVQFATQGQNAPCQGDSMSRELQTLMMDADNSMEELLNSSINQFTRYLEDKDNFYQQHNQLIEQNNCLRASLDQLKNILKSKLESALQKQKEELTVMMEDYIKLITKLLKDKEELTLNLENLEAQLKESQKQCTHWEREARDTQQRMEELAKEKDQHINKTKKQIDEFLQIIDQYEEEADNDGRKNDQLHARIMELEQQLKKWEENGQSGSKEDLHQKISTQSNKIQTLIELLQRSQEENKVLRESLHKISQSDDKLSQLESQYRERLEQLQKQHQQEFMEYQKAVRETISKKDQCIERLNSIVDGYRSKRGNLECSMETTVR